jgi:hypothetical protein
MRAAERESALEIPNSPAQNARIAEITRSGATGGLRHCVTVGVEINGAVDEQELRDRLAALAVRRPALGSVFTERGTHLPAGGDPVLRRRSVAGPDPESRWSTARAIADFEAQRPFAPGDRPLVRALLLSTEADRHLLVLNLDQLVSDAWSANLVVDDLFEDSGAGCCAEPDAYPALWRERHAWLTGPQGTAALERRRARVAGAHLRWPLPLDPDPQAPQVVTDRFVALDDAVTGALRERIRTARGSLLAAGATALALACVADPDTPLALLSTLAGREEPAEQTAVGWFANEAVIPLPARVGTLHDYAKALRGEIFAAIGDQRVPFPLLREGLEHGAADGASCALVFLPANLSGGRAGEQRLGGAAVSRTALSICPTGADIDFFLIEDAPPMGSAPRAALTAGVSGWCGTASPETLERLLHDWVAALGEIARRPWPETPVGAVAAVLRSAGGRAVSAASRG